MLKKRMFLGLGLVIIASLVLAACAPQAAAPTPTQPAATAPPQQQPTDPPADEEFVIGMILVGPREDHGWNEAHFEGAEYVLEHVPNTRLEWIDKVNPADRPGVTVEQLADDLVARGARLIITNSAEFKDGTNNAARAHPDVVFIHVSGDSALDGTAPPNLGNVMGRMEYGKMIAGCAAALESERGHIAYLGPLIDPETRRLVNSSYLGARYCWENYRDRNPDDLRFTVTWIGFWFNIPGVTLDPTQVANDFFNSGADVIMSGIDTTEAIVVAGQRGAAGEDVLAVPYDYVGGCSEAPSVCLGVPYFNWGPAYVEIVEAVRNGTWTPSWDWLGPDWSDLNNHDTSAIGWIDGPALSAESQAHLQEFIAGLADGSINLWAGPLNFQDGSVFVPAGQTATDEQVWYTEQLLQGIEGQSQ
jgi:simple sugar transport system substrate-binding protein